jgi:hypothetical protein
VQRVSAIAAGLFALIGALQLVRFIMGWEVTVNGIAIPVWASGIAFVIAAALAIMLWREARR